MPEREIWDVVPRPDGWAVQREGTSRADSMHKVQEDAITRATDLARRAAGQVRIKGREGRIRDERTYQNDPYPPAG
jgi:hypothetical protein